MKIIPVMLRPTKLHPRLEDIQYLDFTGKIRSWDKLVSTVQRAVESKKYHKKHISENIPTYIQQAKMSLQSLKATEREEAFQSLAIADHPAAHEAMIEALEHPLKEMRIRLALALAESEEPKVVPILINALYENDNDIRKKVVTALVKVGLPSVAYLHNVLGDSNIKARCAAAEALGEIGDESAVSDLLKLLHNTDQDSRVAAVTALGKIKDSAATQSLLEILRDIKNGVYLRNITVHALGDIKDINAITDLNKCLLNDNDELIRSSAAIALSKIGGNKSLGVLLEALQDSDDIVRLSTVMALGKIADPSTILALAATLNDRDLVVVDRTLGALRHIGTPEALAAIENWQDAQKHSDGNQARSDISL